MWNTLLDAKVISAITKNQRYFSGLHYLNTYVRVKYMVGLLLAQSDESGPKQLLENYSNDPTQ